MDKKDSAIVLIFNKRGEMALQLRAAHDRRYPSHWDFAAGGGIDPVEDPQVAAVRETKEEIGADVSVEFIDEQTYRDSAREDHLYIYRATYEGPFTVDPNEVEKIEFFAMEEIKRMMDRGAKFHPEFPFLWDLGTIERASDTSKAS